jgi:hypothetical protein
MQWLAYNKPAFLGAVLRLSSPSCRSGPGGSSCPTKYRMPTMQDAILALFGAYVAIEMLTGGKSDKPLMLFSSKNTGRQVFKRRSLLGYRCSSQQHSYHAWFEHWGEYRFPSLLYLQGGVVSIAHEDAVPLEARPHVEFEPAISNPCRTTASACCRAIGSSTWRGR